MLVLLCLLTNLLQTLVGFYENGISDETAGTSQKYIPSHFHHSTRLFQPTGARGYQRFRRHWIHGRFSVRHDQRLEHHTFSADSLSPISSTFSHEATRTDRIYVNSATPTCGRWIITGSCDRKAFLYVVSNASRNLEISSWEGRCRAIELGGNSSEVGVVDWGHDIFAACYDREAVRAWSPDVETRGLCERDPKE